MPNENHPLVLDIRARLIEQAVDLHGGCDPDDVASPEYLRGQAELIANATGAFLNDDDAPLTIHNEIIRQLRSTQVDPADERLIRDDLDRRVVRALEVGGLDLSDGILDIIINTDKLIRLVQSIVRNEVAR